MPSVAPKEGEGEKQQIGTLRGPAQVSPDMILASIAQSSQMRLNSDSYELWGSAQSCTRKVHFVVFFTALMSQRRRCKEHAFRSDDMTFAATSFSKEMRAKLSFKTYKITRIDLK